ncbi:metallophosphoesterase family protein [Exiguobacterium antarcticum]|uniref:Phosphoesterase n=1 Tax=Exiguobacterium antarcticum TaxID=132920 RepID=A0ABT6R3M9_9BACL|nr:metallophosphoesterase [Exiguobacterium antarcticum]AFS71103.1 Calcineurin-like phosphoesterase superfamily domain protein [Exiguobacterium antarcticum B7]MDI3235568.1 metallophosphoesterase [Exiguobacterium antarcticum]
MKALIVSDSHGLDQELLTIFDRHQDVDLAFHCGDSQLTGDSESLYPYRVVKGNCDYGNDFSDEVIEDLGSYRVLCLHGHRQDVKYSLDQLVHHADQKDAAIVLYGHSHVAKAEQRDGKLFINPGSIRMPRHRPEKTYALLTLDGSDFIVDFYDTTGERINALHFDGTL